MFLKYTAELVFLEISSDFIITSRTLFVLILTLKDSLGPICHWTYASQYMKTCFLTPSIGKKAQLLLLRHLTVIENEYE